MKTVLTVIAALLLLAGCQSNGETAPESPGPGSPNRPDGTPAKGEDAGVRLKTYYDLDQATNQWMNAHAEGNSVTWTTLERSLLRPIVDRNRDDLVETLADGESGRLRIVAARALGFSSEPEIAMPALVDVLDKRDPNLVSSALVSLYVLAEPTTPLDRLVQLLAHPDPDIRVNDTLALYAILRARREDGRVPLTDEVKTASGHLLALVSSSGEDPFVRAHAAAALGEIGDPMAADVLVNLLADPSSIVRTRSAEGLGKLGREEAIPPLVDLLGRAENETERTVVVAALAAIARKQGFPVDERALGADPSNWRAWYMAVKRPAER